MFKSISQFAWMFDARIGFHPASSHPLRRLTSWTRLDTTHHHKGCNEDGSKRVELHVCEVPEALHLPWFARFHTFTPWRSWTWLLTSDKVTSQQHDFQVDLQQECPKKDGRLCRLCTWSFNFRASWIRHKLQPLGRQTEDGANRGWNSGVESKSSMTIRSGSKNCLTYQTSDVHGFMFNAVNVNAYWFIFYIYVWWIIDASFHSLHKSKSAVTCHNHFQRLYCNVKNDAWW